MHNLTIAELIDGLRAKTFSSVELTEHFLARIKKLDTELNSFITVAESSALESARAADKKLVSGETVSPLCGIPIAHKDIFCTDGIKTTCGSKMLGNFIPPYDATVVENFKADGVVTLGKTNMDEFAMGSSNETSYFGAVKNPWDQRCVPGGSSGGSAAAVAARLAPGATATDTGGSIRQPASLCGLTGLKPTYGRVSRWGMIAFASSLDQAGTLTQTAKDSAIMLQSMASYDPKDSTCINKEVPDYSAQLDNKIDGLKIGVPREYFSEGLDPGTANAVKAAIDELTKLGAKIVDISLPHSHLAVPTYYVIAPAECSANLSRFDGVRYGYRCDNPQDLEDLYKRSRGEGFGDEVKRRILVGTYALSAGYYNAYYRKAQQIRRLIKQDFMEAFKEVDVIVGPTAPSAAFEFGAKKDPVAMYMEDIYTIATNLAGLPALSTPCGLVDNKPVGLQVIGNFFAEAQILNVAHQFQLATDHHQQKPQNIE
ncbi:Asp-tRNA(Asn)/Glu-tRNA(Gln) amidotransferase subunit GatA [Aurantivibrio infirmus]